MQRQEEGKLKVGESLSHPTFTFVHAQHIISLAYETENVKKHPNKHIQAAIEEALNNGWIVVKSGKSSHSFVKLRCGKGHSAHTMSIWSTPRRAETHARQIRRMVSKCQP